MPFKSSSLLLREVHLIADVISVEIKRDSTRGTQAFGLHVGWEPQAREQHVKGKRNNKIVEKRQSATILLTKSIAQKIICMETIKDKERREEARKDR